MSRFGSSGVKAHTDECFALEVPFFVRVQLDTRCIAVQTLGDHAIAREYLMEFLDIDIVRKGGDVDGGVNALLRLGLLLLDRRCGNLGMLAYPYIALHYVT